MLPSILNPSKLLWFLFPMPLFMSLYLFSMNKFIIISWNLLSFNSTSILFPIILDPWGTLFSSAVLFISANVMWFAIPYMKEEKFMKRFSHIVLLFVLSMNLLIFIPNLICLLLGWDGLGIVSFILVIYYQNPKSLAAGMITALMNRVGDVMILLSIALLMNMGHWSIISIWHTSNSWIMTWLIMIAGLTKSAQIPFSSWLPAAMAAPTPVSALVHSSTLVTAGVFLLFRFHNFLMLTPFYLNSLLIISAITMLMAGITAVTECDMKKIIALSTLSQLGVMMSSLGLNLPNLAFFHLITHALFKALLFLTAGSMISFHFHSQDMRFMGNMILSSPLTISSLLIANLALCGSPFLAGFYSKDLILEMSLFNPTNMLILTMLMLATMLTASYSMRFMIIITWNSSNSTPFQYINDQTPKFTSPMIFLSMGAIVSGTMLNWLSFNFIPEPILPLNMKLFPLFITIIGSILAYKMSSSPLSINYMFPMMHFFNMSMWFLHPNMSQGVIFYPLKLSHFLLKSIDMGWLEYFGSKGIIYNLNNLSTKMMFMNKNSQTIHLSMVWITILIMML
uniref:NADH dehydrogenase subunit 5 n=1 Tax=Branchipolynoe segonzaci TaxID=907760 RepID=UPI002000E340|nr:NADH dehydrogenase subunit 5 [Branchinotogluma segonzaci]UNQ87681.1 NADH dehydrogenase subunit 5 [Branchinotogluma segonzaci]